MSRIGKQPVAIPAGVKVQVADGKVCMSKAPRASWSWPIHPQHEGGARREGQGDPGHPARRRRGINRALHGLTRSLIANMVEGVTKGFEKQLKIEGIGYQARMDKKTLVLTVGYANAIEMMPPEGVTVELADPTTIVVKGRGQAEGRPVRRRGSPRPQAGTVQGQGHPLRERAGPPQGRQVLHQRRLSNA